MLRIQKLREAKGLSRSALARIALMHAATVGQIESRYIGQPYQSQLEKLAGALEYAGDAMELLQEVDADDWA
jgi:transcriptional regulator with XRE-family HTH domain